MLPVSSPLLYFLTLGELLDVQYPHEPTQVLPWLSTAVKVQDPLACTVSCQIILRYETPEGICGNKL